MAFAVSVVSRVWNENTLTWSDGPEVLLTKNSFSRAQDGGDGTTQVWTSDGQSFRAKQTIVQMETFLNSP